MFMFSISTCGWVQKRGILEFQVEISMILLMAEILHLLIGGLSHYLQGFIHPRWCRISSINSITLPETNIFAPENWWLEDDMFLLKWSLFEGTCSFSWENSQACEKKTPFFLLMKNKNAQPSWYGKYPRYDPSHWEEGMTLFMPTWGKTIGPKSWLGMLKFGPEIRPYNKALLRETNG